MLGVLRQIAETVKADEGEGAVKGAINAAIKRLIAFEMQLGPFAVAQLRILAEVVDLTGSTPKTPLRMFVTNTLGNPEDDEGWIPGILAPIAKSRKEANKIKREESITVVIGNPPYKEKAKGQGDWIEQETKNEKQKAPLADWMPPREWGAGVHSKHLRNLYVYFWRWATWKVYDHGPGDKSGIVCSSPLPVFSAGRGFRKCVITCAGLVMTSGSSTARPRAISRKSTPASFRTFNSPFVLCWPLASLKATLIDRQKSCFRLCRVVIVKVNSRPSAP